MPIINSPVNDAFLAQFNTEARYYYDIGGRWSGKTWEVLSVNIDDALQCPKLRITAAKKVYGSISNSLFDDLLEVMDSKGLVQGEHYQKTVSPLYIRFNNGSDIIFKGADDSHKLKGISRSHRLIMEELNEFTQDDFETIDFSMRGKNYPLKTYLMHNPVPRIPGSQFWFQKMFDNGKLEPGKPVVYTIKGLGRVCALKSTYKDNKACPKDVVERLEGLKIVNPLKYKLWTLGEYTDLEGVVFKNWDIVDSVPEGVLHDSIGIGLDFGFSNDPAAALRIWLKNDELWIQGLIYKVGLTNKDLIDEFKRVKIDMKDIIIADSAEPKSIEDVYRAGYRGVKGCRKRANYKEDMANRIRGFKKIHILAGDIDLHREISTYSWARDKNDKQLPKLQDGEDHYMDAMIMRLHEYYGDRHMSVSDFSLEELGL